MIIDAKDCWNGAIVEHTRYFDEKVTRARDDSRLALTVRIYEFLVRNHNLIRDGAESDFRTIQAEFESLLSSLAPRTQDRVKATVRSIFNYDYFSEKRINRWCAYKLCEKLEVLTCPYCNLAYGHTLVIGTDGRIRPALDHFFDKARYPLFAISLGNFIPSCHHCNSSLKGTKDFLAEPHLNPLDGGECIKMTLDADMIDIRTDIRTIDSANIAVTFDNADERCRNSVATFLIKERYQLLISEARDLAKNMTIISSGGQVDPIQREWVLRGVSNTNYKNRVLGKLIMDFSEAYLPP